MFYRINALLIHADLAANVLFTHYSHYGDLGRHGQLMKHALGS